MRPWRRQPLVSVIMASYNHAAYVEQALASVFEQGVADLEVIVVDDGSSDGTAERVAAIADPRLRLIRLEQNRRYHPRNLAISQARGKYLAFQNSDDRWLAGKLSRQLELLEGRPEVAASFTAVEVIGEDGQRLPSSWASQLFFNDNRSSADWLKVFFYGGNCLCLSSAVVRRALVKQAGGFRPSLFQLADLDLWVRLAAVGELDLLGDQLTQMRLVGGENFSSPTPAAIRRHAAEYVEVLARYDREPVFSRLPEAFAGLLPEGESSALAALAGLIRHAWSMSPSHIAAANRMMAAIIDDPVKREALIGLCGTEIIREFIARRGEIECGRATEEER